MLIYMMFTFVSVIQRKDIMASTPSCLRMLGSAAVATTTNSSSTTASARRRDRSPEVVSSSSIGTTTIRNSSSIGSVMPSAPPLRMGDDNGDDGDEEEMRIAMTRQRNLQQQRQQQNDIPSMSLMDIDAPLNRVRRDILMLQTPLSKALPSTTNNTFNKDGDRLKQGGFMDLGTYSSSTSAINTEYSRYLDSVEQEEFLSKCTVIFTGPDIDDETLANFGSVVKRQLKEDGIHEEVTFSSPIEADRALAWNGMPLTVLDNNGKEQEIIINTTTPLTFQQQQRNNYNKKTPQKPKVIIPFLQQQQSGNLDMILFQGKFWILTKQLLRWIFDF
jgi:hypothetical protein